MIAAADMQSRIQNAPPKKKARNKCEPFKLYREET